jgi:transcriptional regulator with XRE-family HTH domain
MSELGQLLKKARKERGITLDDLQETTKIRKRYLEAIEEGNYKVLPGNFYVRAFIRSYAEAVDLDPNEVLKLYRADVPEPPVETKAEPLRRRRRKTPRNTQKMNRWLSALLFISFPLLIIAVIYYFRFNGYFGLRMGDTPADDPLPLTDRIAAEEQVDMPVSPAETLQPEPEPEPEPEPVISLLKSEGIVDYYLLSGTAGLVVTIEVTGDRCWMAIRKDDENGEFVEANLTMKNGEKREWTFEGGAFFHFGRANAIKVTVNGLEINVGDTANPRKVQIDLASEGADQTAAPVGA